MNEKLNKNVNTSVYDYGKNRIIVKAHFLEQGPTITDAIKQMLASELRNTMAKAG